MSGLEKTSRTGGKLHKAVIYINRVRTSSFPPCFKAARGQIRIGLHPNSIMCLGIRAEFMLSL